MCSPAPSPPTTNCSTCKQIGADYVSVQSSPDLRTAEGFLQIKKRYADAGITVWNIGNVSVHNMQEVTLNLPGRDRKIEEYKQYIRNLGHRPVSTTPPTRTWATASGAAEAPPFADAWAREFDMASPNKQGVWDE